MALLVVLHRVKDFGLWRQMYGTVAPLQKASGVTTESVYQAKDNPKNVLVLHTFNTMAEAEALPLSPSCARP